VRTAVVFPKNVRRPMMLWSFDGVFINMHAFRGDWNREQPGIAGAGNCAVTLFRHDFKQRAADFFLADVVGQRGEGFEGADFVEIDVYPEIPVMQ
jgi:hypothetical protein